MLVRPSRGGVRSLGKISLITAEREEEEDKIIAQHFFTSLISQSQF